MASLALLARQGLLRSGAFRPTTATARVLARGITSAVDEHFLVTATGKDRAGIVTEITKVVLDNGGDVNESRMMRMGGDFTIMMRVAANTKDAEKISQHLSDVQGMKIFSHTVSPTQFEISPKPSFRASFKVVGINHPGLVYRVTEMFYQRGCNVEVLSTDTKLAPFGGTVLFIMDGEIMHEKSVDLSELRAAADKLELDMGIDVEIEELALDAETHKEPITPNVSARAASLSQGKGVGASSTASTYRRG